MKQLQKPEAISPYMEERLKGGGPSLSRRMDEQVEDILIRVYQDNFRSTAWENQFITALANCINTFYLERNPLALRSAVNLALEVVKCNNTAANRFLPIRGVNLTELEWTQEQKSLSREVLRLYLKAEDKTIGDWERVLNTIFRVDKSQQPFFDTKDDDLVNAYLTCISVIMPGKNAAEIQGYLKALMELAWDCTGIIFLKKVIQKFWYLASQKWLKISQNDLFELVKIIGNREIASSNPEKLKAMSTVLSAVLKLPWTDIHNQTDLKISQENIERLSRGRQSIPRFRPWEIVGKKMKERAA